MNAVETLKRVFRAEHVITYDFETFYDSKDGYSLSKLTAEQYIRDPRYQTIMCSMKVDDAAPVWRAASDPSFEGWLRSFPWGQSVAVGHNSAFFDNLILAIVYGIQPKYLVDTLLLARPLAGAKESNSLAALARKFGLPEKRQEVYLMDGRRLETITPGEMADYGAYCALDADLCLAICARLLPHWQSYDLGWMHLTQKMMTAPAFELDRTALAEGMRVEAERKGSQLEALAEALQGRVPPPLKNQDALSGLRKAVGSDEAFANILRGFHLEDIPRKKSEKKTATARLKDLDAPEVWTYAFAQSDAWMQDVLENGSELPGIEQAVQARLGAKSTIMETRLKRFDELAAAQEADGEVPMLRVPIRPFGAHTSRDSAGSGGINVQNLGARPSFSNPLGKKNWLRRSMRAPTGHYIYDIDESQVEVRVLGGLAGEPAILDVFGRAGADPYIAFAQAIYHREIVKGRDKRERDVAKSAVLGNGFGQGAVGFQGYCARSRLEITIEEAREIVEVYRREHPNVVDFWGQCGWALDQIYAGRSGSFGYRGCCRVQEDSIILPSGNRVRYRGLEWSTRPRRDDPSRMEKVLSFFDPVKHMRRHVYGSLVCENLVQGAASIMLKQMAVDLAFKHGLESKLVVHDALTFIEPEENEAYLLEHAGRIMRQPRPWMDWIPLDVEAERGRTFADMEGIEL